MPVPEGFVPETPEGFVPDVAVKAHYRRPRGRPGLAEVPIPIFGPGGVGLLPRQETAEALPMAAAMGAGLAAAPVGLSIPAAAAAGSLGEAGSQALMGEPLDPMRISQTGATQGLLEAGGLGLGKLISKASGPIMQLALRVGDPEIAMTAIREGIRPTKLGVQKLLVKLGQYGRETDRIASQAKQSYLMLPLYRQAYGEVAPKIEVSMTGEETRALQESLNKFVGQNPQAYVSAEKLHSLKKAADEAAKQIYNLPLGVKPTPAQQAASGFYKAFADRARQTLNTTVAGYEASNAPTEALIKLKDVLKPTVKKEMSKGAQVAAAMLKPSARAAIGGAVGAELPGDRGRNAALGAGLGLLGGSPGAMAGLSFGLQSPLLQLLLQQAPRSIGGIMQNPAY